MKKDRFHYTGFRKPLHGFTLIELLVVISIIAMLLSILLPSLGKAKDKARSVVCRTHLKQWGLGFKMYATESKEKLFEPMDGINDTLDDFWMSRLWPYVKSEQITYCLSAKKPTNGAYVGSAFEAWGPFEFSEFGQRTGKLRWASYGINYWALNPLPGINPYGRNREYFWKTLDIKNASSVPLLLDAAFSGAYSENISVSSIQKPLPKGAYSFLYSATINSFCIDRHNGKINSLFMDMSVRDLGLKELWSLKWHRNYNTNELPSRWPDWIR